MIWLERPPWRRWLLAAILALLSIWVEVRPDTTVDHPFALVDIEVGDVLGPINTESRPVPAGMFTAISGDVATQHIARGDPVLATAVDALDSSIPPGWWVISAEVPRTARRGSEVRIVLLDSGRVVAGIVTDEGDSDPFNDSSGSIAVEPDTAAEVAMAAASGRIAVMLTSG